MMNNNIAVFYHCAKLGVYEAIDKEIVDSLKKSGILKKAMFFKNECSQVDQFEFPTLEMIKDFAKRYNYKILYIHTKGATNENEFIADWRRFMLWHLVDQWETCVSKLDEFDTVGIFRQNDPVPHYKGNFWWANAGHINRLKSPREADVPTLDGTDRHKAEFWLLSQEGEHHCKFNLERDPYGYSYKIPTNSNN